MMSAAIRFERLATTTFSYIEPVTRSVKRSMVMEPISTTWRLRTIVVSCRELAFLLSQGSICRESLGSGVNLMSMCPIEKQSCMAYHFKQKSYLCSDPFLDTISKRQLDSLI